MRPAKLTNTNENELFIAVLNLNLSHRFTTAEFSCNGNGIGNGGSPRAQRSREAARRLGLALHKVCRGLRGRWEGTARQQLQLLQPPQPPRRNPGLPGLPELPDGGTDGTQQLQGVLSSPGHSSVLRGCHRNGWTHRKAMLTHHCTGGAGGREASPGSGERARLAQSVALLIVVTCTAETTTKKHREIPVKLTHFWWGWAGRQETTHQPEPCHAPRAPTPAHDLRHRRAHALCRGTLPLPAIIITTTTTTTTTTIIIAAAAAAAARALLLLKLRTAHHHVEDDVRFCKRALQVGVPRRKDIPGAQSPPPHRWCWPQPSSLLGGTSANRCPAIACATTHFDRCATATARQQCRELLLQRRAVELAAGRGGLSELLRRATDVVPAPRSRINPHTNARARTHTQRESPGNL
jgi:hypothetical protein